jgi:hypothetical protein
MTVVPLHKPPSRKQAQIIIRKLAGEGKVHFDRHSNKRKKQRKISDVQILTCLSKGYVTEDPFVNYPRKGWETSVQGSAAGQQIKVVVCLRWKNDLLVVTVY